MDVTTPGRASTGAALLAGLGVLAGCGGTAAGGGSSTAPPEITVQAGGDKIKAGASQYCLDGEGQKSSRRPPIVEVLPDTTITLTVPDAVAEAGWSVQVYDKELQEKIGEVDVPDGAAQFDEITTSDVVPPTFYLVVVQHSDPDACSGLSGAWPVGFIRTSGDVATTSPSG
jgi:hypothetical protein